jgi:hypothetical protein
MRASSLPARVRRHGLSIVFALFAAPALSAAPPAPPAAAADPDAALEVKAKAALAAEPGLAGLALMVSVVDRIAVVGGPVPDAGVAARVEAAVRKVPGLTDVRVSCWVPVADDGQLRKLVGEKLRAEPAEPVVPPLAIVPRPSPEPVPPTLPLTLAPRPTEEPQPTGTVTVQRIAAPQGLAGLLLDPVAAGGVLPMPAPATAYPAIPAAAVPVVPAVGPGSVPAVLAALRKDPRFAGLTVELKAGVAVIGGRAAHADDAWEFAAAVRKLPGVERVVLGDVR